MFDLRDRNQRCDYPSYEQLNLMNTLRKLWEQHVWWTRSFIISVASDIEDLELVTDRLLRNPTDFANVLAIYYGNENAEVFKTLLEEHLKIGAAIVTSAKEGNSEAVDENLKKWYDNADEIAAVLASINPYWDQEEWRSLLYDHLKMTTDEAVARLSGEFAQDIMIFDMIETQALAMADVMSAGIIRQLD